MNYPELTRRLRRLGIRFYKQGHGSHEIWWDPERRLFTTISYHGSRDLKRGTLRAILGDLELSEEDLRNA